MWRGSSGVHLHPWIQNVSRDPCTSQSRGLQYGSVDGTAIQCPRPIENAHEVTSNERGHVGGANGTLRSAFILAASILCLCGCNLLGNGTNNDRPPNPTPPIPAYGDPVWSPNGLYIGFDHRPLRQIRLDPKTGRYVYEFDDSLSGFWIISSSGGTMRQVLPFYLPRPSWTKDGGWIAFEQSGQIWKVPALSDTTFGTAVPVTSDGQGAQLPSWSPDGHQLVYDVTAVGVGVRIATSDGAMVRTLASPTWQYPDWHPRGHRILFLGQVGSSYGLSSADTLGSNPQSLGVDGIFPTWSPDGSKVAYLSLAANPRTGPYDLWVADSTGGSARRLSTDGVGAGRIAWSPDGTRLAYLRLSPKDNSYTNGTLWIVHVDSGVTEQLTRTPG